MTTSVGGPKVARAIHSVLINRYFIFFPIDGRFKKWKKCSGGEVLWQDGSGSPAPEKGP